MRRRVRNDLNAPREKRRGCVDETVMGTHGAERARAYLCFSYFRTRAYIIELNAQAVGRDSCCERNEKRRGKKKESKRDSEEKYDSRDTDWCAHRGTALTRCCNLPPPPSPKTIVSKEMAIKVCRKDLLQYVYKHTIVRLFCSSSLIGAKIGLQGCTLIVSSFIPFHPYRWRPPVLH